MSRAKQSRRRKRRHRIEGKITAGVGLRIAFAFGVPSYEILRPQPGAAIAFESQPHISYPETATYATYPPTSRPPSPQPARWGIHEEPMAKELQVHNLEDGGFMVQYKGPAGCETPVAQLEKVMSCYDKYVILAPYPQMSARTALTSWRRLETLETFMKSAWSDSSKPTRGADHPEITV